MRAFVVLVHGLVAGHHQLHLVGRDGPPRDLVQRLQHVERALRVGLGALDPERLVAALDLDVEGGGERAQVFVEAARQVGQAGVVGRDEGVAKDHEDDRATGGPRLSPEGAAIIEP